MAAQIRKDNESSPLKLSRDIKAGLKWVDRLVAWHMKKVDGVE